MTAAEIVLSYFAYAFDQVALFDQKMENGNHSRIHIQIYADSRGAWLGRELGHFPSDKYFFTVVFRRGASLARLWEMFEFDLLLSDEKMIKMIKKTLSWYMEESVI